MFKAKQIVIETKAILVLVAIVIGLYVAFQIKTVILAIFISTIIALGLAPAVDYLVKKGIPRGISVVITYVFSILIIGGLIATAITPMVNQTIALANSLPKYAEQLSAIPELEQYTVDLDKRVIEQIGNAGGRALQTTLGAVSGLVMIATILVFTAYLLLDFDSIRDFLINLFPKSERKGIYTVLTEIEHKLGMWLRGQIVLMFIIGSMSYIGLWALGIDYALSLSLIAGLMEIIPIIGPIIATIPALIVAFAISPIHGLGVIGLYLIIQQLENNFIVPKVMQKAVGFNPLVTMIAILAGGSLFGVLGALLAVPVTLVATIIFKHYNKKSY